METKTKQVQGSTGKQKLVVEYHYNDGDCGAYTSGDLAEDRVHVDALWAGFSTGDHHDPTHIVIRHDSTAGNELSMDLYLASKIKCKDYIEKSIISLVEDLKAQARHQAHLRSVKFDGTPEHAGKLLWEAHKTADTAAGARACGNLVALFNLAEAMGLTLSEEVETLKDWQDAVGPF